jgi:hypothetical protein
MALVIATFARSRMPCAATSTPSALPKPSGSAIQCVACLALSTSSQAAAHELASANSPQHQVRICDRGFDTAPPDATGPAPNPRCGPTVVSTVVDTGDGSTTRPDTTMSMTGVRIGNPWS